MGYTSFEFNYGYYLRIFYKENVNSYFRSKTVDELTKELKNLMAIYRKNLQHAQELQKQAYNKSTKSKSYVFVEKVWLNSKYIKTKYNRKIETKLFRLFQVLYPISSQTYKLKLPKQLRIHNVYYMSFLE